MGGVEEPVNLCTCTHRGERGGAGSQLVVENNMMRGLYCQRAWLFTVGGEITSCFQSNFYSAFQDPLSHLGSADIQLTWVALRRRGSAKH